MTYSQAQGYDNGARFARAYARSYGVNDAVRSVKTLEKIESPEYVAGMCDTLLVLVQNLSPAALTYSMES